MAAFHCCVPKCTNDSRYDPENLLSFHKFPREKTLKKKWLIKIKRDIGPKFQLSKATRVCSAHFMPADIRKGLSGKKIRLPGAVPTKFAWTQSTAARRVGPKKRCQKVLDNEEGPTASQSTASAIAENEPVPMASSDHDYVSPPSTNSQKLEAAQCEIVRLQRKLDEVQGKLFFLERFANDSQLIAFYTGFRNYSTLKAVFVALQPTAQNMIRWSQIQRNASNIRHKALFKEERLPLIDQFFMFLCRVKQGLNEQDLAIRFNISQSSVSRILITWTNYLYFMLGSLQIWPSRAVVDKNMPVSFKTTYPKTRVVIDCTEIKIQTPSSKVLNSKVYSSYKSHTTFKALVGITPCGVVSFVSALYTGAISDKEITSRSGIVDLLETQDQVMADKGFLIQDLLDAKQASLVIPPFLGQKGKFSEHEVAQTHEIARLRIHVERAIRRMKEYHIFDGVIPLSLASSINQIWTVCAILTIFRPQLF